MILDATDPGPLGDYPNFPRNPDGSPCWVDTAAPDATVTPMPRGPRNADGTPLNPPTRLP